MTDLAHIAARAFNTPLLIEPGKAEIIADVLLARMGDDVNTLALPAPEAAARRAAAPNRFDAEPRDRYRFAGGVALIPVFGTLINRGAWIGSYSGLSSYEGLGASLAAAVEDADVETIVLDLDSGGGEAAGAFEASDKVRAAAAVKPVVAFVNSMAASAAYAIASAATKIVVTPSAVVGSIGVVLLHLDRSGQMAKAGVKPTLIFAGASKVDGNPFSPLPEGVRDRFQAEVDGLYGMFVEAVGNGRKGLSAEAIRGTEARMFMGQTAVDMGLADSVGSLDDALSEFSPRGGSSRISKGAIMANESATSAAEAGIPRAEHESAIASAARAANETGAFAERERIGAILNHAEASGRETLARHLAFHTALTPADAAAMLAASPKAEAPAAPKRDLSASVPNPAVAPDSAATEPANDFEAGAAEARAILGATGGVRRR